MLVQFWHKIFRRFSTVEDLLIRTPLLTTTFRNLYQSLQFVKVQIGSRTLSISIILFKRPMWLATTCATVPNGFLNCIYFHCLKESLNNAQLSTMALFCLTRSPKVWYIFAIGFGVIRFDLNNHSLSQTHTHTHTYRDTLERTMKDINKFFTVIKHSRTLSYLYD